MEQRTFAIYARQSQDRTGEGLAVDRQIAECRKLAKRLKLPGDPVVYIDNDVSASSGKPRAAYERLLTALAAGKHRTLLVWHPDRLHRRPVELERFIAVVESSHVHIHTVVSGVLDLSTSNGRMVARMLGAAARGEMETKSDRQKAALAQKRKAGKRTTGFRSFGYEHDKETHSDRIVPSEAKAIRDAFRRVARGESTTSVWTRWNREGILTQNGNKWTGTTFRRMMMRPSLAGMVSHKGEILEGVKSSWPAIVERDQWAAVQAIFSNPARRLSPGPTPKHLSGGVTRCECGAAMKSGVNSLKSRRDGSVLRRFGVYKCSRNPAHCSITRDKLDAAVREGIIDAFYWGRPVQITDPAEDESALTALHGELETARKAEERLVDAIADGTVTKSAAAGRGGKIRAEIARVQAEITEITSRSVKAAMLADTWAEMLATEAEKVHPESIVGLLVDRGKLTPTQALAFASAGSPVEREVREQFGARFDAMELEQKRELVRSTLKVTVRRVGPGVDPSERVTAEPL